MKVKVNVNMSYKGEFNTTVLVVANMADTTCIVKDRVALIQPIPFPDQELLLDGSILEKGRKLSECGFKEGKALDLVVNSSEKVIVQQVTDLLESRDLTCDELGLLYCYKYGASINQALKIIGFDGSLQDFVRTQKSFAFESGRVALLRDDTSLKPFSVATEVETILKNTLYGSMGIREVCAKFAEKYNISLASAVNMKPIEFFERESQLFSLVQKNHMTNRGLHVSLKSFEPMELPVEPSTVEPPPPPPGLEVQVVDEVPTQYSDSQLYQQLHDSVSARSFHSSTAQALKKVVDHLMDVSFLNIEKVVKGGSVGKGTAISGGADAEVVFFLQSMPYADHAKWLPPLLQALSSILNDRMLTATEDEAGIFSVDVGEDSLRLVVEGLDSVDIRFSPSFESHSVTVQAISEQSPDARCFYSASLAKEKVQFIARQPGQVKVTIRLLKWWRNKQEWSSAHFRPSDDILELIAVYSSEQTKPEDQDTAIGNVLSLMAKFNDLCITWTNFYEKDEIWTPLLAQKPLLMDLVNPYVNVADPQWFDARELMLLAKSSRSFW